MANWYDNVPAPVDANGREVPLDTVELVYKGETRNVLSITYSTHQKCWFVAFWWLDGVDISACTLPDSWELLEKDTTKSPCEYFGHVDGDDSCYDCHAHNRVCGDWMMHDIISRAKALAGVTDGE